MSEDIELCLYAAAEHVDDVEAVALCFYPNKKMEERCTASRSFKRQMDPIRKPFSSKANFIKHNHARLRLFSTELIHSGRPLCLHGFFIEQHSDGLLGPSRVLHTNGEKVLSVVAFLWDVLAYAFETSVALSKFIQEIAPTTVPEPVGSESFIKAAIAVARLPNYVMDRQHPFRRVLFSLTGSSESALDSGLYGSIKHPWANSRDASFGSWRLAYEGDGVSKGFAIATPQKVSLQNWNAFERT